MLCYHMTFLLSVYLWYQVSQLANCSAHACIVQTHGAGEASAFTCRCRGDERSSRTKAGWCQSPAQLQWPTAKPVCGAGTITSRFQGLCERGSLNESNQHHKVDEEVKRISKWLFCTLQHKKKLMLLAASLKWERENEEHHCDDWCLR
jgi:hypothetical protein